MPETNGEPPARNGIIDPAGVNKKELDVNEEDEEPTSVETPVITTEEGNEMSINHAPKRANTEDDWESRYAQSSGQPTMAQTAHSNGMTKLATEPSNSENIGNHSDSISS